MDSIKGFFLALFADWNATATLILVFGFVLARALEDILVMLRNIELSAMSIETNADRGLDETYCERTD